MFKLYKDHLKELNEEEMNRYTGIAYGAIDTVNISYWPRAKTHLGGKLLFNNYFYVNYDDGKVLGLFDYLKTAVPTEISNMLNQVFPSKSQRVFNIYVYDVVNDEYRIVSELGTQGYDSSGIQISMSDVDFLFLSRYKNRKIKNLFSDINDIAISVQFITQTIISSNGGDASEVKVFWKNDDVLLSLIYDMYITKWKNLYQTILEYDYLKPFSITLNETSSDTLTTTEDSTEYADNDQRFVFNSSGPVDTDKANGNSTRKYSRTNPKSRNYTRVGNIGNQSYADLTIKEREKAMFNLKEIIMADIASLLLYDTYND